MFLSSAEQAELAEIQQLLRAREGVDYTRYRYDPGGFIVDFFGETLTPDLEEVCHSVVNYSVTIAQSGNGTGKSYLASRLGTWFYKTQIQPQVYCAAAPPESNLRNIVWSEISYLVGNFPTMFADSKPKDLRVERSAREFMTGVSIPAAGTDETKQARFSGKHAPSLFFIVDEADAVPDPVFSGIETCLSGGFERLLCMFNPRQRMGSVYRMIKSGQANVVKLSALNHPNVTTGENVIPGAVSREKTLRRIAQWTRPLQDGEVVDKRCFQVPPYLENLTPTDQRGKPLAPILPGYRRIVEHQFSHVVLGEYPAQSEDQLISEEWIDKARSRYDLYVTEHGEVPPKHIRCIAGVDVAEKGPDEAVLAKRYANLLLPLISWEGKTDPIEVGDLVAAALEGDNVASIKVEGTGVGSGTAPYLARKNLPAVTVKVASSPTEATASDLGQFGLVRDQLLWAVREWLRNDLAMLPPDPYLIEELTVLTWELDQRGKIKVMPTDEIKALLGRSPDRLMAVAMGFYTTGKFSNLDLS